MGSLSESTIGKHARAVLRFLPFLGLLLLVGLFGGLRLALAGDQSPSPAGKVVLRVGWTSEPDNLNPFIGWSTSSYEVWSLNYDFLVGWNAEDMSPAPNGLAQSWQTSSDGKTWTFHLRPGVKWQDGQPCTAEDVAWTFNYIIDNSMYAYSIATTGITKVVAVDPTTVKVICSKPKADMLHLWIPMLPKHVWQSIKPSLAGSTYVNKPPIIGTGPFQTVAFKKGSYVRMVANRAYWRGAPHIDEIIFQVYQNADAMTDDLKSGAIDAAWGIPQAQFDALSHTPGVEAVAYNFYNWDYLCFNCYDQPASTGAPTLRDREFRRALNYAIDRQKLVEFAWHGDALPGTTIMTTNSWTKPDYHWEPPAAQRYTFDMAKAGAILDAAGYRDTNGDGVRDYRDKPITLRLWAPSDVVEEQTEARLLASWFGQLGLKIKLETLDPGVYNDRIWNFRGSTYAPDFDMYVWGWDGYADPGQTLSCFTTPQIGGWNEPCWSNAQFNALYDEQATTLDPNKRKDIVWRMQQIMYAENPEIVLTYPKYLEAYNTSKWTGWTRVLGGKGPAIYTAGNTDTYLNLRRTAVATSPSSSKVGALLAVTAALAAAALAAWLLLRGRKKAVEEE